MVQTAEHVPAPAKPRAIRRRVHRIGRALASVGPIALMLTTYSLLLDHVPRSLFTQSWLDFVFCGAISLCVGLVVWLLGQWALNRHETASSPEVETVAAIFAHTRRALIEDMRTGPNGDMAGWSQYLGATKPPTAVGTANGLQLLDLLDAADPRIDRSKLLTTMRAHQAPGGGWHASSQQDNEAKPEATAWVLVGAVRGGLPSEERARLLSLLESISDDDHDPEGMTRTSVVVSVVTALAELAPDSPRLSTLVGRLAEGAIRADEKGKLVAWGGQLGTWSQPQVALTARVVCALDAARTRVRSQHDLDGLIAGAIAWLRQPADQAQFANRLQDHQDDIRRRPRQPATGRAEASDLIVVGTFTAAWVARALLVAGPAPDDHYVRTAIRLVCERQWRGTWPLGDRQPIWMTAHAVRALREYALRGMRWPP